MSLAQLRLIGLRYATLFVFLAVLLYFGLQAPRFLTLESIASIVKQASFIGVVAVGMTFVLLTAGIDLSVGSNMYLSAMAAGYLLQIPALQNSAGVALALIAGLAAGLLFGAINATCIVVLRISPFLVTLATLVAGRGLGTAITESFGIEYPPPYLAFGASAPLGIPTPIWLFAIIVLAGHVVLTRTQFGRQIYAIGNDAEAARKAGIPVGRITFAAYVICGLCAAAGGVMLIALIGRLNQTFGVGKEFDVITAAVLGGTSLFGGVGTAFGAVVGSTLVQMVQSGMVFTQVNLYLQPMVLAGIIFLAVLIDALRVGRLEKLNRRRLRNDAPASAPERPAA
jgi:ribose/xylose/arabinose/galactoside ABC-type transport system permease subunit